MRNFLFFCFVGLWVTGCEVIEPKPDIPVLPVAVLPMPVEAVVEPVAKPVVTPVVMSVEPPALSVIVLPTEGVMPPVISPLPLPLPSSQSEQIKPKPVAMPWLKSAQWGQLPGWREDDLMLAWPALLQSCRGLKSNSAWNGACQDAQKLAAVPNNSMIRAFLEKHFRPWQINQAEGGAEGLVTGYYEPLLRGSRTVTAKYRYPIYAAPADLLVIDLASVYPELKGLRLRGRINGNKVLPYFTRAEIESGAAPVRGKELAWVDDAVELFFLQVQGSGRIKLDNGDVLRVGYADGNGHPYRSIGKWLIEQGELTPDKASMQGIKEWGSRHPDRLPELLNANPSYIFFRELPNHVSGPLGALGIPLTPERSIAIDPRGMPLGAPVWLATTRPNSSETLNRLVLAQDTGSAIRGNVRADFFWGFGEDAGKQAGSMKQKGRMWALLPRDFPMLPVNP